MHSPPRERPAENRSRRRRRRCRCRCRCRGRCGRWRPPADAPPSCCCRAHWALRPLLLLGQVRAQGRGAAPGGHGFFFGRRSRGEACEKEERRELSPESSNSQKMKIVENELLVEIKTLFFSLEPFFSFSSIVFRPCPPSRPPASRPCAPPPPSPGSRSA